MTNDPTPLSRALYVTAYGGKDEVDILKKYEYRLHAIDELLAPIRKELEQYKSIAMYAEHTDLCYAIMEKMGPDDCRCGLKELIDGLNQEDT